jgi:23S rRNA pseudouridine2604 synthase
MCSALGYRVQHLKRVRIMNVTLGKLKSGEWRYLTAAELGGLLPRELAGLGDSQPERG